MTAAATRAALAAGVLEAWRRGGVAPPNPQVAQRQALLAVGELVDALRYNPAWAAGLAIGR